MTPQSRTICDLLCRQLSAGSHCATDLCELIPMWWDLTARRACGNCQLQMLLTKQEALIFLMGCEAHSVDTTESHYRMDAKTVADSVSDSRTEAQATGSSTRFARGQGNTRYDEDSNSRHDGNVKRTARGNHKGDRVNEYRDDGRGSSFSVSSGFGFLRNRVNHQSTVTDRSEGSELGIRQDCNYEYSVNRTTGSTTGIGVINASFTGTTSEWRKFQATNGNTTDIFNRVARQQGTEDDTGLNTSESTNSSRSSFINDIDWFENDYDIKIARDRSDHRRDAEAHAKGSGDGINEESGKSYNSAQGTSQTIADGNSSRVSTRVSNKTEFALANSQRFRNLRLLYDQAAEQIDRIKKRLRQNSTPLIGYLPCYCEGYCKCNPLTVMGRHLLTRRL